MKLSKFDAFDDRIKNENIQRGSGWVYLFLDIYMCLKEFYAIIAVDAMKKTTPFKHSHEKWELEFDEYKWYFVDNLAKVIYEYTCCAVLTELRHCDKSNYYVTQIPNNIGRGKALDLIKKFTPTSILELGVKMFDGTWNYWNSSYGGSTWQMIAKAGLMYGKVPNMVFIDHCVDLCHNNGSYFDKICYITGMNILSSDFLSFLNNKKHELNPQKVACQAQSYILQNLIIRGNNLGIFSLDENFEFEEWIQSPFKVYDREYAKLDNKNRWYKENNTICEGFNKILLDDVFEYYHSVKFGDIDIFKTAKIICEPHYDEDGCRREERRREERRRGEER